jgi:tripartite motif-containing protein 71
VTQWGHLGRQPGNFGNPETSNPFGPEAIAVDQQDAVFVVDKQNSRVEKFTRDGAFVAAWGKPGHGPGEFNAVSAISLDGAGNLYAADLADSGTGRVQKFTADGKHVGEWHAAGQITALAASPSGDLYVAHLQGPNAKQVEIERVSIP